MAESPSFDTGTLELTVASYLNGFSLGQLLWGPLGDWYGRREPIPVELLLIVVGSAGHVIGWRIL